MKPDPASNGRKIGGTDVEGAKPFYEIVEDMPSGEVQLGREDGLDLCRSVRSMPSLRHLPIMLLTSLTTIQDKVAGFGAGADDYVVKPFDARHLMARIRLLARIKRIEQRNDQ